LEGRNSHILWMDETGIYHATTPYYHVERSEPSVVIDTSDMYHTVVLINAGTILTRFLGYEYVGRVHVIRICQLDTFVVRLDHLCLV
jgi:hypothetical protein